MIDVKKGQEVFLIGINNQARYGKQEYKAVVKSVGRKWFTVECNERGSLVYDRFSLEDGTNDGKGYISNWRIYPTEEQFIEATDKPILLKQMLGAVQELDYKGLLKLRGFLENGE